MKGPHNYSIKHTRQTLASTIAGRKILIVFCSNNPQAKKPSVNPAGGFCLPSKLRRSGSNGAVLVGKFHVSYPGAIRTLSLAPYHLGVAALALKRLVKIL